MNRPMGITIIGYFYILGAMVLFLTLGSEFDIGINVRFGVPNFSETLIRITIGLFSLIMAYGYLALSKWGYWTMICYSVLFGVISLTIVDSYKSQPFIGNAVFSMIVVIYTFRKRKYFLKSEASNSIKMV